jgi:predicted DNA-binding transcriptional regulator AlpA
MHTITLRVALTLDEEAATGLVELIRQLAPQVTKSSDKFADRREARLRASREALFAGQEPPEDVGLLIDTRQVAKMLMVSARTIFAMQRDGRMPQPVRIGRAIRWSYEGIKAWVDAGCPAEGI